MSRHFVQFMSSFGVVDSTLPRPLYCSNRYEYEVCRVQMPTQWIKPSKDCFTSQQQTKPRSKWHARKWELCKGSCTVTDNQPLHTWHCFVSCRCTKNAIDQLTMPSETLFLHSGRENVTNRAASHHLGEAADRSFSKGNAVVNSCQATKKY